MTDAPRPPAIMHVDRGSDDVRDPGGVAGAGVLAEALAAGERALRAAGVPSPRADAELLAAHVLGPATSRGRVRALALGGGRLTPPQSADLAVLLTRRAAREPLQHLTGEAPFRDLVLTVGRGVFVPRPETEVLAGLAVDGARAAVARGPTALVVDLCTGSGAVALAVATEVPAARVVAVELEPGAERWARRNVDALAPGVDLRLGDAVDAHLGVLADLVRGVGTVDVVAANPPYIPDGAEPLDPEVADHDPAAALYGGGVDGLDVPRGVVRTAAALLRPGGLFLMEHADVQGAATRALAGGPGWDDVRTVVDLAGRDRVLVARRAGRGGAHEGRG